MPTTEPDSIELTKPVLLEFAKAVYICQCFESSLCLLLALMAHEKISEVGAFETSWNFHSNKTLGQLLYSLRQQIEVPAELDEYLGGGVKKRNEIIHGFLTKNARRLADPKARIEIENELVHLKQEVKKRDIVVNKLLDTLFAKYGLSNEILKRNADRYWEHMNPSESDTSQNHKH
jgi:hypothetical protein